MTQDPPQIQPIQLSGAQVAQLHRVIEVGTVRIDDLIRRAQIYDRIPLTQMIAAWDRQIWACVLAGIQEKIGPPGGSGRSRDAKPCTVDLLPSEIVAMRIAIHVALGHIEDACVAHLAKDVSETLRRIASIINLIWLHRLPGIDDQHSAQHSAWHNAKILGDGSSGGASGV